MIEGRVTIASGLLLKERVDTTHVNESDARRSLKRSYFLQAMGGAFDVRFDKTIDEAVLLMAPRVNVTCLVLHDILLC